MCTSKSCEVQRFSFHNQLLLNVFFFFEIAGEQALLRLVESELIRGGQLLEAAQRKGDIDMLQQIEGEDLVAWEFQYD